MWGSKGYGAGYGDIESGSLYPGASAEESSLRWGFVRKVYGILSTQLVLTAIVAGVIVFSKPAALFFQQTPGLMILFAILPLILLCALFPYRQSHPTNLILLGLFTVSISITVGVSCAYTRGDIVLEALLLTATIAVALTAYTFWAVKQGYEFNFLGQFLYVCLILLIVWGLVQAFFPVVPLVTSIYAGLGALVFSGYIVYDTENLIRRHSLDDYVWASIALYLDVLNLFLALLNLLRGQQD